MTILDDLVGTLDGDVPVREVRVGAFWTVVCSRTCGLSSTLMPSQHIHGSRWVEDAGHLIGMPAGEVAGLARSESPLEASIGMAAINSMVAFDSSRGVDLNAGRYLIEHGRGRSVALVGHFPFVSDLREAADPLWVIELDPQPGDLTSAQGEELIPRADIVAITGCTFVNHTVDRLLALCAPQSLVMMLGSTAPMSPVLFEHGVDVISGSRVVDEQRTLRSVSEGATFPQVDGVRLLTMTRPGLSGGFGVRPAS
jgi:uncharacterized protein (DUF4213/DUF364 family)